MTIADHIVRVCGAGGDAVAIEFDGETLSWAAWGRAIERLDALLEAQGVNRDSLVGLLGRNRPEQVSAFIAALGTGRALALVNAVRPIGLIAEEVAELDLCCLLGSRADLPEAVIDAAQSRGTLVVAVDVTDGEIAFEPLTGKGAGPFRPRQDGTLIEIQTSGTTGKPKRIPVGERAFAGSLQDGVRNAAGEVVRKELNVKGSPTLMFGPLVHTSGTINTLMSVFEVRPIVLFEKFDADKYRRALRKYRPKFAPLPPAAMKMMVDSDATREDFSSVIAVRAGTAALPLDLQDAFEEKFGVPVLVTYGATEFMGTAANWSLDEYRKLGKVKRGSVGKASAGVQLRVIDPATGEELPADEPGILEVRLDRIDGGRAWIRTSDMARIDEDGYLFITGRADDAIVRGGFKIMAGKVADVLRAFPGVYDVIVIGMPDERLGEVPVALVEPYPGETPQADAIRQWSRERLTSYEVPARVYVTGRLPRTVSDKVVKPEAKAMIAALGG
ncbi:MAG: acyl--CoA ligase [Novosphingobium sp.]|nr:acyl--CoA ligase [Novosphingobium sp.]